MKAKIKNIGRLLADFFMHPYIAMLVCAVVGVVVVKLDLWDWIDPPTQFITMGFAAAAWWQTRKAQKAYYQVSDNHDQKWIVALEVGRPISEAAKEKFGHLDVLVRVSDVIGSNTLTSDEHYEKVARAVYAACAQAQNREIDLIVSGPNALCTIIGQMLGVVNFKLTVWQFYNGEYQRVPRPNRDWLEHRS